MRRIIRSEAVCLRVRDYLESSKLVTLFTLDHGKVNCIARGARRLKSRFGAALDLFARSRVIYYWRETTDLYTLSDAELLRSHSNLAVSPDRFLAAEQIAEFVLRVIQPHDPNPQLYGLLLNYLRILESLQAPVCSLPSSDSTDLHPASCTLHSPSSSLVCSFLLKAASFLGFRPELRHCLICRRPPSGGRDVYFDSGRGGIICARCAGERGDMTGIAGTVPDCGAPGAGDCPLPAIPARVPSQTRLDSSGLDILSFLLYTPATDIAQVTPNLLPSTSCVPPLDLVLDFLGHHFDRLVLNSFRWRTELK
jgi:DNA repair protein RecO (recombination protein O)